VAQPAGAAAAAGQMVSSELNTVLRRNASGVAGSQQARKAVERGVGGVARLVPRATKEKMVAPVAGFISAAIEITATWPFEYAKTQLQLNRTNPSFNVVAHVKERGLGIYKGITPMLIGAPIQGVCRFSTMEFFNERLKDEKGKVSMTAGLLAGVGAGVLESVLVVAPMETVKTRLINSGKGLMDGAQFIMAKEGLGGFYKGVSATIAKSASNQGIRFIVFNQYKNVMVDNPSKDKLSPAQALGGGMLAGLVGCLGNTPVDVLKSRMQGLEASRYESLLHCATTMVKEEGPMSLYKGLLPRMARVLPGQGIIFASYSIISDSLKERIAAE
jgi:solute carrier family 25 citrate transporter 1